MVWAWPFSIDFSDNNFGCGTKKCMRAGDRKQLYYKSWPYLLAIAFLCLYNTRLTIYGVYS